jgi:predicted lipid-binding transport protein (Tim44 family)
MFKFLGFLLVLGLFGFLVIGVLLGRVIRFFGPEDRGKSNKKRPANKSQSSKSPDVSQKKFSKNEGEYISYEEVKDDK